MQQLSDVQRRAATRPQTITKWARDIAVVMDIGEFREFQQWKAPARKKIVT